MLTAWDSVIDRVFDDVMRAGMGTSMRARTYDPNVDVRSDGERIVLELDVPGVRREDLDITVEHGRLTVTGVRKFDAPAEKEHVVLGRPYGKFSQTFALPDYADGEKLTARLADGVLTIEVPKQAAAKPRKVPIVAAGSKPELGDGSQGGSSA